ncbi:TNF receptor-associated factor 4 [Bacillus rossius redtenbacheri]|uniref:TNF receptor-associated factor 4 n=1 Tax=Bacillus rossius redtenbacheri TaxID=93214 RepID=UPI002FDD7DC3
MGRSLAQWTKTLSFPARISPQKQQHQAKTADSGASSPSGSTSSHRRPALPCTEAGGDQPDSEKVLTSSLVHCIHHKDGCQWTDQLRKLKAHLNTCRHDAVPCANRCGAHIPRLLMEDHLKYTCAGRRARCDFCAREFSGLELESHAGTCGHEPVYCESKCGLKLPRRLLGAHRGSECCKRLVPCRHCGAQFVADTLQAHHAKCGRYPVSCPAQCGQEALPREDLEAHLAGRCPAAGGSCAYKEAGCRFKGSPHALEKHLAEEAQQHLQLVCGLATRQAGQIASLKSALARLAVNCSGTLVWKITNFATKMSDAKTKEGMELVSPPFYTSQYGYKLQASLFLNGNGAGEGTHISIYIKILPGEYDTLLGWPFSHSVAFTLFDQALSSEKACNIVESFIPDPTWKNFQQPSKEPDSLGFGFPRFVSHEVLKKRHFVRDDVLFLRVQVDPSSIVAV